MRKWTKKRLTGVPGSTILQSNLNMRVPVNNGVPNGTYTVVIGFVINTDGSLSDFSRLTNVGYGMEEETIRVIKNQAGGYQLY